MFDCKNIDQCVENDKMDDYYLTECVIKLANTFITTDNRNYEPSYIVVFTLNDIDKLLISDDE